MHPAIKARLERPRPVRPDLDLDAGSRLTTDGAASFAAASSQSLSIADNASLSTGDVDFWCAGWVNLATVGANRTIAAKMASSGAGEWQLNYIHSSTRFDFNIRDSGGNSAGSATANTFGAPSTGTWYFVFAWHDAINNTVNISINGGTVDSVATTGVPTDTAQPLTIGVTSGGSTYYNGQLDSIIFGKSPPGGIAALATTIRDTLYNGGNGLPAKSLSGEQRAAWGVVSGWDFDGPSGNLVKDAIGSNTLTNNNAVTYAAGKVSSSLLTDADAIASWFDAYGGTTWSQSTAGSRPLYKAAILDGRWPVIRGDGTNDFLAGDAKACDLARATAGLTVLAVVKYGKAATAEVAYDFGTGGAGGTRAQVAGNSSDAYQVAGNHLDTGSSVTASGGTKSTTLFAVQAALLDYAGGPVRQRVNGIQHGTSSLTSPAVSADTATSATRLFATPGGASFAQADIARLLCWRRVLTQPEIRRWERHLATLYNINVAG